MNPARSEPIVAVDVGNSRFKLGLFDAAADDCYPVPRSLLEFVPDGFDGQQITGWLREAGAERVTWRIASVHRGSSLRLGPPESPNARRRSGHPC